MARTTLFCADTYLTGARGKLTLGDHREFKTAEVQDRDDAQAE